MTVSEKSNGAHKSNRGGRRPGAGRPIGSRNKRTFDHDRCLKVLADALEGADVADFLAAAMVVGADIDKVREALGLSQDAFAREFGPFILALVRRNRGEAATR